MWALWGSSLLRAPQRPVSDLEAWEGICLASDKTMVQKDCACCCTGGLIPLARGDSLDNRAFRIRSGVLRLAGVIRELVLWKVVLSFVPNCQHSLHQKPGPGVSVAAILEAAKCRKANSRQVFAPDVALALLFARL